MNSRYESLLAQWRNFQAGRPVDTDVIRPEILASWQRCKTGGVSAEDFEPARIFSATRPEPEVGRLLKRVAVPMMEELLSSLNRSKCVITLYDAQGRFIHKVGDPLYVSDVEHHAPGTLHTELAAGTSVISMVLQTRKPVELFGPEHWVRRVHHRCGSGAPLFLDGQFLGLFCCSLDISDYSPLTFALVEMASRMLVRQIRLDASLEEREVLLKLVDDGLLYVDNSGVINYCNPRARALLKLAASENLPPSLMEKLAPEGKFLRFNMRETRFSLKGRDESCIISCFPSGQKGAILSLRRTRDMQAYVAKQAGYTASYSFDSIVGASSGLSHALELARSAAQSDITTLINGESGTGKELFAQAIHNASSRRDQPFIAVNCGAIPRSLIESELFGYSEGAFTGAARQGHPGKFELADGGTIFLDEVGELPLEAQAALLRVLQTREIERIGGTRLRKVNVRIIAATNKELAQEVAAGAFRKELFYRINALTILIPSLAQRRDDIPLLAESFLQKHCRDGASYHFSGEAMRRLSEYGWPGNVRQLENVIDCAVAISQSPEISPALLDRILARGDSPLPQTVAGVKSTRNLDEVEREAFLAAMRQTRGNVRQASGQLGISRKAVYARIKRYGLELGKLREGNRESD